MVTLKKTDHLKTNRFRLLFSAILLLLFISCQKEKNSIPVIAISSPYLNQTFNSVDIIPIIASIKDESSIESIKVSLVNEHFQTVFTPVFFYPKSTFFDLNFNYEIDAEQLNSGSYYIQLRAENKNAFKNEYQKIQIIGTPTLLSGLVVLTEQNNNQVKVTLVDNQYNYSLLTTIEGDFMDSEIDSKSQRLYLAGESLINLLSFGLEDKSIDWELEFETFYPQHTLNCLFVDDLLYASYGKYFIKGINAEGSTQLNIILEETYVPTNIITQGDYLIADIQRNSGGNSFLITYNLVDGSENQRLNTSFKVVEFLPNDMDNILIISNSLDGGLIHNYDPYLNELTQIENFPEVIRSAIRIDNTNVMLGTQNDVVLYNIEKFYSTTLIQGKIAYKLRSDNINPQVYIVGSKTIEKYEYPVMEHQETISFPDSIMNVHLLYNK